MDHCVLRRGAGTQYTASCFCFTYTEQQASNQRTNQQHYSSSTNGPTLADDKLKMALAYTSSMAKRLPTSLQASLPVSLTTQLDLVGAVARCSSIGPSEQNLL